MLTQRRILVAPLNWGLGHATRCIPIIKALLRQNQQVLLASDGRALDLLRVEFPNLPTYELPAYNVTYRTANMFWNIGWQLPKIAWAVQHEQKVVEQLVAENNIDIIIADNRFGACSRQTRNIFLTHQLHLKIPFRPLAAVTNGFNHYFIRRFDEVWIPDFAAMENSLAASLSHPSLAGMPTRYLGALSRFSDSINSQKNSGYIKDAPHSNSLKYDIFVLLSGPEPQRTFLEKKLTEQLKISGLKAIIAQGKTEIKQRYHPNSHIEVVSYLTASEIEGIAKQSKFVLCRSGYSTIMDLYYLGNKAVLIPTPGQTEQEYLAEALKRKGIFYSQSQRDFDLATALKKASTYASFQNKNSQNKLSNVINQFLQSK